MSIIKQRSGIIVQGQGAAQLSGALNAAGIQLVSHATQAGLAIIAQDGATPARALAHQALGLGQSIVSANPLLWALCGQQLSAVAQSQKLWLGMEAALMGTTPLQPFLATSPSSLTMVFSGAADSLLQRLAHFHESPLSAEAQLRLLRTDMSDLHGKLTAARATIVGALAHGNWAIPTRRTGLDAITAADVAQLSRWGLTLRYAATVTPSGITTAPLAFPNDSPLANLPGCVMTDDAAAPTTLFATSAPENNRILSGLVSDITVWRQRATWAPVQRNFGATSAQVQPPVSPTSAPVHYVRGPALFRTELLAGTRPLQESYGANNSWQALIATDHPNNPEVFVLPVQMPVNQASLRATA